MKTALKITLLIGSIALFNSCALFGGKKKKCNECPTWGHNQEMQDKIVIEEKV